MNDGLMLTLRYASNCQMAEALGVKEKIKQLLEGNGDEKKAKEILKFLDFYRYHLKIAKTMGKNPFSHEVVSAYWKGSDLIDFKLFHNWTTLGPIVTMPMGKIEPKIIDDCFVHSGEIVSKNGPFVVRYRPVIKGEKLVLGWLKDKELKGSFLNSEELKNASFVTFHFETAIERINEEERKRLIDLSEKALKTFNAVNKVYRRA